MLEIQKQNKTNEDLIIEKISEEELELIEKMERGEFIEDSEFIDDAVKKEQEKTEEEVEAVVKIKEKKKEKKQGKKEKRDDCIYIQLRKGLDPKEISLDTDTLCFNLEITEEVEEQLLQLKNLRVLDAPKTKRAPEKLTQLTFFRGDEVEELPDTLVNVETLITPNAKKIPTTYSKLKRLSASDEAWEIIVEMKDKYEVYKKKEEMAESMGKKMKTMKELFPHLIEEWDKRKKEWISLY